MIKTLIIALFIGFLTKFADSEHGKKITKKSLTKIVAGILYGFMMAFVVKTEPLVAPLFIATVIGVTISGKIDAIGHFFGISSFVFFLATYGLEKINLLLLLLFLLVATVDELVNTYIVDRKRIKNRLLSNVLAKRPFLEIAAFAFSAVTGAWIVWFSLLFFDVAYNATTSVFTKI
ncbi:hypothetical protein JXA85_02455 [Candidatus Woesearchaeota archaeon]|nr:hypothetical protein [Candidatus Woesearchaeota archaeon]